MYMMDKDRYIHLERAVNASTTLIYRLDDMHCIAYANRVFFPYLPFFSLLNCLGLAS